MSRHSPPQRPNNQPGVEGGPAKGTQSYFPGGTMVLSVKHSPDCSPGKATSGQMSPTTGNTACLRTALLLQWSLNSLHRLATQGCPAHWAVKGGRMKGRKKKQTTPTAIVRGFTSASLTKAASNHSCWLGRRRSRPEWLSSFCSPIKAGLETKR